MSSNINQIFINNPITGAIPTTALTYFGLSPFGVTNDAAASWSTVLNNIGLFNSSGNLLSTNADGGFNFAASGTFNGIFNVNHPLIHFQNYLAGGQTYNSDLSLSASLSGTTVTGTATDFNSAKQGGLIYWPSSGTIRKITTVSSTTSLTVSASGTQTSAPFIIYFPSYNFDPIDNVFIISNLNTTLIDTFLPYTTLNIGSVNATLINLNANANSAYRYLFTQSTLITTMSQTGILATITGLTSAHAGAYVVPASGSPFVIVSYQGTTTAPTNISQTIAGGTACTLYYYPNGTPLDATGTGVQANVDLFSNTRYLSLGGSSLSYVRFPSAATSSIGITSGLLQIPSNSGNQTASQSTTTVTGVGTSWNSSYVGHMIRYATGQIAWITAVASTTSATVTPSQTVAATAFDIPGKTTSAEATSMDAAGNFGTSNAYINNSLFSLGASYFAKRAVTATPDTVAATDYALFVNFAGAVTENIPAATGSGRILVIKDASGAAATNNITITPASGTIDGASTLVINTNYGAYTLIDNASGNWSTI